MRAGCPRGTGAGIPPHRHRAGVRKRVERRPRAARERHRARRGVHHDQVPPRPARPAQRGRPQHRPARHRLRRPLPRPLAGRRGHLGLARDGGRPRAQLHPRDRRLQLRRRRARSGHRRCDRRTSRSTRCSSTRPPIARRSSTPATERGVALEAYSPLGTGALLGDPVVADIADRLGRSPAQVLLRWCVQRGIPVITKSTHRDRIAENAQVFDFELSAGDMERARRARSIGRDPSGTRAQMVVSSPRTPQTGRARIT